MSRAAALQRYLSGLDQAVLSYGRFDCALFCAGWIDALRGTDYLGSWQGRYKSLRSGLRAVRAEGYDDLAVMAEALLTPVSTPLMAQVGDIALLKGNVLALGIVGSGGLIHVLGVERGLDVAQIGQARRVFRP